MPHAEFPAAEKHEQISSKISHLAAVTVTACPSPAIMAAQKGKSSAFLADSPVTQRDPAAAIDIGGPARWDDVNEKVTGLDYEYANLAVWHDAPYLPVGLFVVLAEKPGIRK